MASYPFRSFSRYRRRGSYSSQKYRRSTSVKRRAYGNLRSAAQQRDSTEVVINTVFPATITIPQGSNLAGIGINVYQQLAQSQFYSNYAPMYDQFKLNGVRVKVNGSIQGTNASSYLTPTITTAWDRNGIEVGSTLESLANNISTYSSAITKPWSLGNAFIQTRTIWAETIQEKSQYLSPSNITPNGTGGVNDPSYPIQVPAVPWKPTFFIQISLPTGAALGGQVISFTIEMDIIVKFRGLRKGSIGNTPPTPGLPISIDSMTQSGSSVPILLSSFQAGTGSSISLPTGSAIVYIGSGGNIDGTPMYAFRMITNSTGNNVNVSVGSDRYHLIDSANQATTIVFRSNNTPVFTLADTNTTNNTSDVVYVNSSFAAPNFAT